MRVLDIRQLGYSLLGQSIENSDFEVNAKGFLAEYYQLDKSDSNNSEGKTLKNKKYKGRCYSMLLGILSHCNLDNQI